MWSFQGAGNPSIYYSFFCILLFGNYKVRKKKKKPAEQRATSAPAEKKTSAPRLSNGFVCPGGKLGVWNIWIFSFSELSPHFFHFLATHQVHIALPHPTDCRKFYTCLDGITPRDQGCPARKVFNPTTSSCDDPTNVVGCETYYNKPEPRRPPAPPPVSQVGLTSYIKS